MQIQVGSVPEFPGYPRIGVNGLGNTLPATDPMQLYFGDDPVPGATIDPNRGTAPGAYGDGCYAGYRLYGGAVCVPENSIVFNQGPPAQSALPPALPVNSSPQDVSRWCAQGLVYDPTDGSCNPLPEPGLFDAIPGWIWAVSAGLIGLAVMGRR